jgi:hypothetical protein
MANLSELEEGRRSSTDIGELYRADFASSDESRHFVFLPAFDCRGIPEDTVEVV